MSLPRSQRILALLLVALPLACAPESPEVTPEPPTLRRLTNAQFVNVVHDLLGDVVIPGELDPDVRTDGLVAIGAARTAYSPRGVENIESTAFELAAQVLVPERRDAFVPCTPEATVDAACAEQVVRTLGRRAWRRPLEDAEVTPLVGLAGQAASTLGDFYEGLEFAVAGLLQSPHFLYRVELGAPDPTGTWVQAYTDWEMASRLSFLLWNTMPDDALLDAAESGVLSTRDGLWAEAARMLEDPRARSGLLAWFDDMMRLDDLDDLYKEPAAFPHISDTLPDSAREEAHRLFLDVAFGGTDPDLRNIATSRKTFVNRELATLYNLPAPVRDGFAAIELPPESLRRGFFGQAAFLAPNAHPVSSSATLRGKFVREVFLCAELPGPPSGVDTSIPPVTEQARTLRQRVQQHLVDPSCASCHRSMDLVGLGFENFDGIGRYRTTEEGAPIDASGEIDGVVFQDAAGLAEAVREHEDFGPCLAKTLVRYANGVHEELPQLDAIDWLSSEFAATGYQLDHLVLDLVTSPLFRQSSPVDTSPLEETE